MTVYSDYIVFVDETGDHGLASIDPSFPVFGLTFCVIEKAAYAASVVPAFTSFKFTYWGHDCVVLHEHEIRKSKGSFAFLLADPVRRNRFNDDLTALISGTEMHLISSVIMKSGLVAKYARPWNPYEIALMFCMERLLTCMLAKGQRGRTVHVVFECRGKAEDAALELEFRRIAGGTGGWGYRAMDFTQVKFEAVFAKKTSNSIGLQLADMTARPVALKGLRPTQPNRAYDAIASKIFASKNFP